jgi:3-deoxy-D-manno-octulosonate 8-phosphate phosphatase (KDO 8-P phosphatase)
MSKEMRERSKGDEESINQRLAAVRLAVFDVDGTLTDGSVCYVGEEEQQSFSARDGYALARLASAGIAQVWITGRGSSPTRRRAEELGVTKLLVGVKNKTVALAEVQAELGVSPEETLAMGDDLPDLEMRAGAGLFAAPGDAAPEVVASADIVTEARGGKGAAREVCQRLLIAQGAWPEAKA